MSASSAPASLQMHNGSPRPAVALIEHVPSEILAQIAAVLHYLDPAAVVCLARSSPHLFSTAIQACLRYTSTFAVIERDALRWAVLVDPKQFVHPDRALGRPPPFVNLVPPAVLIPHPYFTIGRSGHAARQAARAYLLLDRPIIFPHNPKRAAALPPSIISFAPVALGYGFAAQGKVPPDLNFVPQYAEILNIDVHRAQNGQQRGRWKRFVQAVPVSMLRSVCIKIVELHKIDEHFVALLAQLTRIEDLTLDILGTGHNQLKSQLIQHVPRGLKRLYLYVMAPPATFDALVAAPFPRLQYVRLDHHVAAVHSTALTHLAPTLKTAELVLMTLTLAQVPRLLTFVAQAPHLELFRVSYPAAMNPPPLTRDMIDDAGAHVGRAVIRDGPWPISCESHPAYIDYAWALSLA
ncbi:hypothetical protein GGF32_009970 [Allomyces javanicus]|nr:hypothetical protein GGF32_009970 [Allomyces javanicus]